jgi:hypothetical protein
MSKSTEKRHPSEPEKPHPDFPLFPHAGGRWAKKVRGKFHYFGQVADDPQGKASLDQWLTQKDELLAGRMPRVKAAIFATLFVSVAQASKMPRHARCAGCNGCVGTILQGLGIRSRHGSSGCHDGQVRPLNDAD